MTPSLQQDQQLTPSQRAAAIERVGRNTALRSGAGCGKTMVLARRYAQLLIEHADLDDPLSHFVALTFTDKATLEMIARVRKTLAEFARQCPDQRRVVLDWLGGLGEARISTIHGFCSSLLRAHAIEAGLDPNFAVCADTLLAAKMRSDAVERSLLAAVQREEQDVLALLADTPFERLADRVRHLSTMTAACDLGALRDAEATVARWRGQLQQLRQDAWGRLAADAELAAALDGLSQFSCADGRDRLAAMRDDLIAGVRALMQRRQFPPTADFAFLEGGCSGGSDKAWGGRGSALRVRDAIRRLRGAMTRYAEFAEDLGPADEQAAEALAIMARQALKANDLLAAQKRRQGILEFDDLLTLTARLIESNPAAAAAVRKGIEQLLVDEAQDTDAFQIRLLEQLAFPQPAGPLPQGKLFIVGDAKQSIYRFRGADVGVFESLCTRLGEDNQESLRESFRTHACGVEFINHLFAPLMGPGYEPMTAHRTERPDHPPVEIILAASGKDIEIVDADAASRAQAAVAADRIAQMVERGEKLVYDRPSKAWRPVRYGDVAILFTRMTNSLDYESMLARRGVPYYVVGGTGFFRQQEVFDILNALAAIDNPFDDVALAGLLRSSLVGLDDNALMHISLACRPPYLAAIAQADLSAMDPRMAEATRRGCELVRTLHARKDAVGIDELIEQLLAQTGYHALLLSQFNGPRMAGNVQRLIDLARAASRDRMPLGGFLSQMSEQIIDESRYEQAAVAAEAQDVVRLMTVHKAKGLEFPVVVLPDLNAAHRDVRSETLWRNDWGVTFKLPPPQDSDAPPPLSYRLAKMQEDQDLRQEDLRRLYVAMTRHEDHLVMIGADFRTEDGALRDRTSDIALLDSRLGVTAALGGVLNCGGCPVSVYQAAARLPRGTRPQPSAGETLLASSRTPADLARGMLAAAPPTGELPLLGPLPASIAQVELATTALGDFAWCPMYYRWQYELRVPVPWAGPHATPPAQALAEPLDAAAMGTLLHRCMELLDFSHPQGAAALMAQAAVEMELGPAALAAATASLEAMLAAFAAGPLWPQLAAARQRRAELEFVSQMPGAILRGKIDLLYQDAAGRWHIVDYKSDRVGPEGLAAHAQRYDLQMQIYAEAASRYLRAAGEGEGVADITLYFLRTGDSHVQPVTAETIAQARDRVASLAAALTTARRAHSFARCQRDQCGFCMYHGYCGEE